MMQFDYLIGGVRLRLYTEEPLINDWQTELFLTEPEDPEITIHLHLVGVLPEPKGQRVETGWETRLFLEPEALWHETYDRKDGTPMLRSRFVSGQSRVDLWARRDYMPHTVRSWVLWSAMDLPWLLLSRDVLTLHSASILHDGQVILFSAPSQTGKSTQAKLWSQYRGAKQLNGDKNCVTIRQGRPMAIGTPLSGTSKICTPYEAPLRAIVLLRQAPVNRVTRLRGVRALVSLMENSFGYREVPGGLDRVTGILSGILSKVPVFCLECTPDENAVLALEAALRKED